MGDIQDMKPVKLQKQSKKERDINTWLYTNLSRFDMLETLDTETKHRLFPILAVYQDQLVKVHIARWDITQKIFALLTFVGLMMSIFSTPALASLWLGRRGTISVETVIITGVVAVGVLSFISWFPRLIKAILPFSGRFRIGGKLLLFMVSFSMVVVFFGLVLLLPLIPSTMKSTLSYAVIYWTHTLSQPKRPL